MSYPTYETRGGGHYFCHLLSPHDVTLDDPAKQRLFFVSWYYQQDVPKKNKVRFTPVQVEAIRSGMNPGLTMVVGPPGTGALLFLAHPLCVLLVLLSLLSFLGGGWISETLTFGSNLTRTPIRSAISLSSKRALSVYIV